MFGVFGPLTILVLLLGLTHAASGLTWTQTTPGDFATGTSLNVEILGSGDIQLASTQLWSKAGVVLDLGPPSSYDSSWTRAPSVIKDGTTYRMWYTGSDGSRLRGLYATSPDGVAWTRQGLAMDVLVAPQDFDLIAGTAVMKEGTLYRMWFSGGFWGGGPFNALWARIYYADSPDAVSWTIRGVALDLGVSGSWDDHGLEWPSVARDASGLYYLYYMGWGTSTTRTGVATSTDGLTFVRPTSNPMIDAGPAWEWDRVSTGSAAALPGTPWHIWYTGNDELRGRIGLVTSPDGIAATKSLSNPVLVEGPPGSFDAMGLREPALLLDAGRLQMYYVGWDGGTLRIGLAREVRDFSASGWFQSAVLDSGSAGTRWTLLNATGTVNATDQIVLRTRSGDVPTPDASWSPWSSQAVLGTSPIASPRARYLQVRVELATSSSATTPVLHDFSVDYALNTASAPTPTSPVGGTWLNRSSLSTVWTYNDPEGDPAKGYRVQISTDSTFATVAFDSADVLATGGSWRPPAIQDGDWYWRVRTLDAYDLWSPYSAAAHFRVDMTPPVVEARHGGAAIPSGVSTLSVGERINLSATDSGSGVARIEYSMDGGAWTAYAAAITLDTPGRHVLAFRAIDVAGNEGPVVLRVIDAVIAPPFNWTPLLAVTMAILLAIVGALLARRMRKRAPSTGLTWALLAGPATIVEILIGVYSLLTGELATPPWLGGGFLSVVAVGGGGAVSLVLGVRALAAQKPPTV